MQTYHTYSVLFWLNKARIRNNEVLIFLRITINGKRSEISLKRSIEPSQWNSKTNRAKGNSEQARTLNNFLDMTKGKLLEHYQTLLSSGKTVTADELKNKFLGITQTQKTFLEVFQLHNQEMKQKIGIEFEAGTLRRYSTVYDKLQKFLKHQYKKSDISLQDLSYKFMADFDYYLKTVDKIHHNTAMNYLKNLKNIYKGANGQSWIITNRQKTASVSNVPLLPISQELVEKYNNHPEAENKGKLFPVKSNQKMNALLQEIARLCGIEKHLTCHLARHTFATTVTLSNGVPIETVSAMLGHKSLATTKIYAKVLNAKVGHDMQQLQDKLFGKK